MLIRTLINPINRPISRSGPIDYSIHSRVNLTSEQVRLYEALEVIPVKYNAWNEGEEPRRPVEEQKQ